MHPPSAALGQPSLPTSAVSPAAVRRPYPPYWGLVRTMEPREATCSDEPLAGLFSPTLQPATVKTHQAQLLPFPPLFPTWGDGKRFPSPPWTGWPRAPFGDVTPDLFQPESQGRTFPTIVHSARGQRLPFPQQWLLELSMGMNDWQCWSPPWHSRAR